MGLFDTQNIFNLVGRLNYSKTKIDDELSDSSTNAVQNKVLTEALDDKLSKSQGGVINGNLSIYGICDFNARRLRNVAAPEASADAANKKYVDDVRTMVNGKVDKGTEIGSGKAIIDSASATANSALAVGQNATASDVRAIAIGHVSKATSPDTIAIGNGAQAKASGAVQIGYGTNNEPNTMQIFGYQLLNSSGKIPAQRLNLSAYEEIANKVTSIDENSTDVQYPSAKAVKDYVASQNEIVDITEANVYIGDLETGTYHITGNGSVQCEYNASIPNNSLLITSGWLFLDASGGSKGCYYIIGALQYFKSGEGIMNTGWALGQQGVWSSGRRYFLQQISFDLEEKTNKAAVLNDNSTNETYPSSKAVVDYVGSQKQHNFSTTEKVIGTWIDGSTLYEKVIQFGTWNIRDRVSVTDPDLKGATLISCTGSMGKASTLRWSLPMAGAILDNTMTYAGFQLIPTSGMLTIMTSPDNPNLNVDTTYAIIRYTKTS